MPPAAAGNAAGGFDVLRAQAWDRVTAAWRRQDSKDAADHAVATGVGIRPGTWKGVRERLGIGLHGETATTGPVVPSILIRKDGDAEGEGLEMPSFLIRRGE